ncbi:MAG: oligosaccharide flippase family protein, partial [Clostridia bacterium]|nr:oligosaccharide flippase family protein [Clostridia bacterium]
MKKKKTFLINTVILTVTALILRAIGLFFRVYLSNVIGAEGMGLYQLIFSVYMLASTFATNGISTAVTRLCADEMVMGSKKSVFAVIKKSVKLSAALGAAINILVFAFSSPIATVFIGDARAIPALKILSFSLVPMGVSACFKGYFMARRKTLQPSLSSILEQLIRMAAVFFLLAHFAEKGLETACFAVLAADTIAETSSCVFMAIC